MNAYMNINVRVLSANAQAQIKALQLQVASLQKQLAAANATSAGGILGGGSAASRSRKSLGAWGNQLQWTGRQIQYNFTLPLILAGAAATKFALDNERAMTRVTKVYGDQQAALEWAKKNHDAWAEGAVSAAEHVRIAFENETAALGEAFEALSSHYGVQQKEVIETAAAWAAAGASGRALAESTQLSLKAAVLGEMDLAKATESLIAIQAQYSLNTKGLSLALAELNAIENQTGISMQGLIDGFARSAGVAREAGVDVRHLGAMLAALVPATGTAATAGNALKTIISRLMAPTGEAADVMKEFGVNTSDAAWQSSTAMERLMILARHMDTDLKKTGESTRDVADDMYELSDSQKQVVATTLGSRYQMNRFLVLMRELGPAHSYFEKALDATADKQAVFAQMSREVNRVLESNPKRLEILWYTLQNGMADAIAPMIPYILYMVSLLTQAVQAFANLDPAAQKFFFVIALGLASIGLFMRYLGSTASLLYYLARGFTIAGLGALGLFTKQIKLGVGTKVVTTSLWGMATALLAMPFRFVSAAIGAFIGLMLKIPLVSKGLAVAAAAFKLVGVAAVASMKMFWKATSLTAIAGLVRSVAVGVGAMVSIWTFGLISMTKRWAATWVAMSRAVLLIGVVRSISAAMKLLVVAMGGALLQIVATIFAFYGTVGSLFTKLWFGVLRTFAAFQAAFYAAWSAFSVIMASGMTGLYIIITQIAAAGSAALVAIQAAMYRAWSALAAAFYPIHLALTKAWHVVMVNAQWAWAALMHAVQSAAYAGMLAIQRAWQILMVNAQWAWAAIMHSAQAAYHAGMVAIQRGWQIIAFNLHLAWTVAMMTVQMKFLKGMAAIGKLLAAVMTGPWGIAIAAVVLLVVAFRDQITQIWNNVVSYFSDSNNAVVKGIIDAWNMLPQGVANALTAVARIVQQAALQIYEWFSYINPFARHSPSLVENVTAGMDAIDAQFARLGGIGGHVRGAYADINAFGRATAGLLKTYDQMQAAEDRKQVTKFAPGALDEYDALRRRLKLLEGDLARIETRMNAQQAVVDRWQAAVDKLNHRLQSQQYHLDKLVDKQQKYQDLVSEAAERLDYYQNAGIQGERAMSDAIFENEMAQKRLRLEMMRMENAGQSFDDIRSKINAINGELEMLRGTQANLRAAGAGSDVLSFYDDQIKALEEQKRALGQASGPIQDMQNQLDALQREGEELDLLNSLQFDPLRRQIEQAGQALVELPFGEIIDGTREARADMEKYQQKLDEATRAVERQQNVVDRLTEQRDKLQYRLDQETYKLDQIKKQYDKVNDAISEVESALDLATQAASGLGSALDKAGKAGAGAGGAGGAIGPAVKNFRDAAGGNFAQVGGAGIPMRKDWADQSASIKDFTKDLANQTADVFADLNPFTWIQSKWGDFKSWWSGVWADIKRIGSDFLSSMFSGVNFGGAGEGIGGFIDMIKNGIKSLGPMWDGFKKVINTTLDIILKLWRLFWPNIKGIAENAWEGLKSIWSQIGPELGKFWKEIKELGPALKGIWNIVKVVVGFIILRFSFMAKIVLSVIEQTIKPALEALGGILKGVIRVVRGIFQFLSGFFALFTGDFETAFKKMGAGIGNIFGGLWDTIWAIIKGAGKIVVKAIWGVVKGIWDWFVWLWDELVGHSIIPDIIDGIIWYFNKLIDLVGWLWNNVIKPIFEVWKTGFKIVIGLLKLWWAGVKVAFAVLKTLATWFWDNVLQPLWEVVKFIWSKLIWPYLKTWWEGVKIAWGLLKGAATWLWDNVLYPAWLGFKLVWDEYIYPFLQEWWARTKEAWNKLKDVAIWLWDEVIYPAWLGWKRIWDEYIHPFLKEWWGRIKRAWNKLKGIAIWLWNEVLVPIYNKVKDTWEKKVKPELDKWRSRIESVWNRLKTIALWVWNNVLKPIWDQIKKLWDNAKEELSKWRERIERAWDALTRIAEWVKKNVMDPVFGAIKDGWNSIRDWMQNSKDMLTAPAKAIVNVVASAINTVISGLNRVSEILPGFEWHIDPIQKLAQGGPIPGRRGNRGMVTNGARAIVGEGKANYPEFVIPTDPTYRRRATSLLLMAASKIGMFPGGDKSDIGRIANSPNSMSGVPAYDVGGWLGDRWGDLKDLGGDLVDQLKKLGKNAIGKIMHPLLNAAYKTVHGATSYVPAKVPPLHGIIKMQDWVTQSDADLAKFVEAAQSSGGGKGLEWARTQVGKPYVWGGVGPDGYDCSGFMAAIANVIQGKPIHVRRGGTGSFPWPGFKSGWGGFTIGSTPNYGGSGVGHMAGTIGGVNVESAGGVGVRVGPGARGAGDPGFSQIYHLAKGAIVRANQRSGGVLANIGEGRYDEAVIPLPRDWKRNGSGSGETHIHINGNLEFPNITDGNDAEEFIRNLTVLAKD